MVLWLCDRKIDCVLIFLLFSLFEHPAHSKDVPVDILAVLVKHQVVLVLRHIVVPSLRMHYIIMGRSPIGFFLIVLWSVNLASIVWAYLVGSWRVNCSLELWRVRHIMLFHISSVLSVAHFSLSLISQFLAIRRIPISCSLSSPLTLEHERDLTVVLVICQHIIARFRVVLLRSSVRLGIVLIDRVESAAACLGQ